MRYWKQITVFTLLSFFAQGQYTHKVIKDTPDDIANYWINVGLFEAGYAMDNNGYGLLGSSLGGVVHYKNKFGGELFYKYNWYSMNKTTKSGTQFEIGGFFHMASKSKSKSQKVILAEKSKGNDAITMNIPATIKRSYGLRAGLTMLNEGLGATNKAHEVPANIDLVAKSMGIYAGVLMTSSLNARCHTQEFGIKSTGFVRRNYLDVLINPVNKITNPDGTEYTGTIKKGVIGFRLGVQFLQAEPKKITGTAVYHKLELGSRPIDGYYASYTLGFNFKRRVKSMSSFVVVREKE